MKPFDKDAWAKQVVDELGKHAMYRENCKPPKRERIPRWLADGLTALMVATGLALLLTEWLA